MRAYVTGANGLLGNAILRAHLRGGDVVFGCDVQPSTMAVIDRIDIRDRATLTKALQMTRPDRIYHCAAMLGVQNTEDYPKVCTEINTDGTASVIRAAITAKVREIVFLSSSEVYGEGDSNHPFDEYAMLRGSNVYALSKRAGERIVMNHREYIDGRVVRMFNCYGPRQVRQFFIPRLIGQALTGKPLTVYGSMETARSYLHSDDAATHIMNVADNAPAGSTVNVAHPVTYTHQRVCEIIAEAVERPVTIDLQVEKYDDRKRERDVRRRLADTSLLRVFSNHTPRSLERGIRHVVAMASSLKPDWTYARETILD